MSGHETIWNCKPASVAPFSEWILIWRLKIHLLEENHLPSIYSLFLSVFGVWKDVSSDLRIGFKLELPSDLQLLRSRVGSVILDRELWKLFGSCHFAACRSGCHWSRLMMLLMSEIPRPTTVWMVCIKPCLNGWDFNYQPPSIGEPSPHFRTINSSISSDTSKAPILTTTDPSPQVVVLFEVLLCRSWTYQKMWRQQTYSWSF